MKIFRKEKGKFEIKKRIKILKKKKIKFKSKVMFAFTYHDRLNFEILNTIRNLIFSL